MARVVTRGFHERVFTLVARVPAGFVTTYGDVAEALGLRRVARQVGWALAALPAKRKDVPWQRVVNGKGEISVVDPTRQARLLRKEGVAVDARGRVRDFAARRIALEFLAKR